jgi:hypothetical protein
MYKKHSKLYKCIKNEFSPLTKGSLQTLGKAAPVRMVYLLEKCVSSTAIQEAMTKISVLCFLIIEIRPLDRFIN